MKCRCCHQKIIKFFSLNKMPLVNSFLKKEELPNEKKYDLSIGFCPHCYLVQLIKTVSPNELFRHYLYFSSNSQTFLEHARETANYLTKRLKLNSKSLVLEIASNDGTQLQYFKNLGIPILGIDPAENIAEIANKKGIKTIAEFYNYDLARKLLKEQNIKADLIYGANVLAHVPKIVDFVKGVRINLRKKGTAVFEFPYLRGLFENKFDIIYHEHVFYYSLLALMNLFKKAGLEIYDVEQSRMQGGSLRIFVSYAGSFKIKNKVHKLLKRELRDGFNKISKYREIKFKVNKLKVNLISLLQRLKKQNKRIAAYSAPAKGNILLNFFDLKNYLDFIVDKAKEKQGLYTPGTHLQVFPPEKIILEKPDYLLVLCWNITEEIINQLQEYKNQGGRFIIPIPDVKII